MVYPKSHLVDLQVKKAYHELDAEQMKQLADMGINVQLISAKAGDTLIMQGGVVVRGSVEVPAGSAPRFVAYAHFALPRS